MALARPMAAAPRLRLVILMLALMQIGAWLGTAQRAAALPPPAGTALVHQATAVPVLPGPGCQAVAGLIRGCVAVVVDPASALADTPPARATPLPRPTEAGLRGRMPSPELPPPRARS